ncbi:MAG TPA: hypothetical protein QGH10_27215 [Armatimonadota bacterium]|nr:hypothetical protein [Armatimonadota bacterium]
MRAGGDFAEFCLDGNAGGLYYVVAKDCGEKSECSRGVVIVKSRLQ